MKNVFFTSLILLFVSSVVAQDGDFHLDKEYKMNKTGTIDLSSSDAKVFITGSNRNSVHVKIDRAVTTKGWAWGGEDFRVDVEESDGDLRIRERQRGSTIGVVGYYRETYKIEIEAPEGVTLTVRGDDGDYYIKNINGSISLSLDDADAELSDCNGSKFRFRLDDGDLRMNKGKGSIDIDADDADVEIYQGQFSAITAEFDDGDLIIETSLTDNGEYYFNSQDGLISLSITGGGGQFDIRHDEAHVMTMGDFKTSHDSENHTVVSLASGSAKVTVRADDARVKLSSNK
ncbi:MAG: DUF4097 family beta strand repeat-containing protein [Bacteroidota bacterium]